MKLFVTGGTGFIGSHFLQAALAAGHEVVALRRNKASSPRIKLSVEPQWLDREMGVVEIADFAGCDALVHLAAVGVSPQKAAWTELFRVNVTESLALWMRAADAGINRLIVCGSCFEYGRAGERYEFIPPHAPLEPVSGYAASKAAATVAALGLASERKLRLAVLRPFQAFGEGQHEGNFWPSLREAAFAGRNFQMTEGGQVRDYMPVADVATAFLAACLRENLETGLPVIENIGTGVPRTLRDFAEEWWLRWQATGQLQPGAIPYRTGEVMRCVPEIPFVSNL
jgi:nucleoside-diphosphate-sugar epimerase